MGKRETRCAETGQHRDGWDKERERETRWAETGQHRDWMGQRLDGTETGWD